MLKKRVEIAIIDPTPKKEQLVKKIRRINSSNNKTNLQFRTSLKYLISFDVAQNSPPPESLPASNEDNEDIEDLEDDEEEFLKNSCNEDQSHLFRLDARQNQSRFSKGENASVGSDDNNVSKVLRYGSLNLWWEQKELQCSKAKWIGVYPSEMSIYFVEKLPLTPNDTKKLDALEKRSYYDEDEKRELKLMRQGKIEIEAIAGNDFISINYLTSVYIPIKIQRFTQND
ncbi:hypothetical protein KQX54_002697 [Cotesia glomerata]|uniref:Topoisomerase 6 subunit A/Spo11 TOPRIM domain-containing protein n=1 Tax=Cotesia glomerata TaxID=32391 RepID=A0AAV7HU86_COTGL|nr:hypothetical protein KQX54_002697 [Cotesia glomerata]